MKWGFSGAKWGLGGFGGALLAGEQNLRQNFFAPGAGRAGLRGFFFFCNFVVRNLFPAITENNNKQQ